MRTFENFGGLQSVTEKSEKSISKYLTEFEVRKDRSSVLRERLAVFNAQFGIEQTRSRHIIEYLAQLDSQFKDELLAFDKLEKIYRHIDEDEIESECDLTMLEEISSCHQILSQENHTHISALRTKVAIGKSVSTKDVSEILQSALRFDNIMNVLIVKIGLPVELQDNVQQILDTITFQKKISSLDIALEGNNLSKKDAKALRAHLFQDTSTAVLPPEVLLDIIEGRYNQKDPYISGNIFDSFDTFQERIEEDKKLDPKRKKQIIKLLSATIAVTLIGVSLMQPVVNREVPAEQQKIEDVIENETQSQDIDSSGDFGKPDISDPEKYPDLPIWTLSRTPESSYFAESRASFFNSSTMSWRVNAEGLPDTFSAPNNQTPEGILSQEAYEMRYLFQPQNSVVIPITQDMRLIDTNIPGATILESQTTGSMKLHMQESSPETENGSQSDLIVYYTLDGQKSQTPPTADHYAYDQLLPDLNGLPISVKKYIENLQNQNLSHEQIVKKVRVFIKKELIYTNDESKSYANRPGNDMPGGYVSDVFWDKYADCDVANTAYIAILRYLGVPSRHVVGYLNNDIAGISTLNTHRRHGWTEWYNFDTKTWETTDATPPSLSNFSPKDILHMLKEAIQNPENALESLFALKNLKDYVFWTSSIVSGGLLFLYIYPYLLSQRKLTALEQRLFSEHSEYLKGHSSGKLIPSYEFVELIRRRFYIDKISHMKSRRIDNSARNHVRKFIKNTPITILDMLTFGSRTWLIYNSKKKNVEEFSDEVKKIGNQHENLVDAMEQLGYSKQELELHIELKNADAVINRVSGRIVGKLNLLDCRSGLGRKTRLAVKRDLSLEDYLNSTIEFLYISTLKQSKRKKFSFRKVEVSRAEFSARAETVMIPLAELYSATKMRRDIVQKYNSLLVDK